MEHLVRFTTAEGREGHHYAAALDDALKFVERLRNTEETSDVRVYRLQQVPIEFRTYYRVELKAGESEQPEAPAGPVGPATDAPPAPVADAAPPVVAVAPAAAVTPLHGMPEPADGQNGRRLFTRG